MQEYAKWMLPAVPFGSLYDFYYERRDLVASVGGAPLEAPDRCPFFGFLHTSAMRFLLKDS